MSQPSSGQPVEISGNTPILIASANRDDAAQIAFYLGKAGLKNLTKVTDGITALDRCASERFELVLVGDDLDRMTPWLFVKECRLVEQIPNMAIVMFGRESFNHTTAEMLKFGVTSYIRMPFKGGELLQTIMPALADLLVEGSIENQFSKAKESLRAKRSEEAVARYSDLRHLTNRSLRSTFGLAQAHDQKGDATAVSVLLEEVVCTDPDLPNAMLLRAKLLADQGKLIEALDQARRCLESADNTPLYYLTFLSLFYKHQFIEGMTEVADAAYSKGFRHIDISLARARAAHARGDDDHSLRILKECESEFGVSAELLNLRGVCLRIAGKLDAAISCYEQALKLKPMDHRVLFNMGLCYESLGDTAQAITFFQMTLDVAPRYEKAAQRINELKSLESGTSEVAPK